MHIRIHIHTRLRHTAWANLRDIGNGLKGRRATRSSRNVHLCVPNNPTRRARSTVYRHSGIARMQLRRAPVRKVVVDGLRVMVGATEAPVAAGAVALHAVKLGLAVTRCEHLVGRAAALRLVPVLPDFGSRHPSHRVYRVRALHGYGAFWGVDVSATAFGSCVCLCECATFS
jgi:hypothetical protein